MLLLEVGVRIVHPGPFKGHAFPIISQPALSELPPPSLEGGRTNVPVIIKQGNPSELALWDRTGTSGDYDIRPECRMGHHELTMQAKTKRH